MSINRDKASARFSLVLGLLLMTHPGPTPSATGAAPGGERLLTDFAADSPDLGWYVQNDNVMGGRSEGGFKTEPGTLIFAGSTNTDGGGFSSIRTQPFKLDLSKYEGIQLRVKADGRRYTWQLQTTARNRGYPVSYWAEFDTRAGEWITVNIPFANFYPQFRGFRLDGPVLDPGDITEFGLYIYDNKDGPFELRLDSVKAYAADAP
ncbi:MAG: CIA30 family protein [Gammaproteobacteria bacterium]|nr:CIA30 family protein [Gammaproteobacteria bacterium]